MANIQQIDSRYWRVRTGELRLTPYFGVRGIDMRVYMSTPLLPQGVLMTDTDPVGLLGVGQA